ncbi:hypothetical protein O6B96_03960 [Campylobacter ureolyticus]|uniref:hypothetical protein n=1 Tax=Campylobacter ureolyticus TaxID=827 RepID=UPI0022B59AF7|nr:hypothetical protein [Campylobacter ureolyticus]MCZ6150213.1 hypothetical protein [Campylobacter ureolyticus]
MKKVSIFLLFIALLKAQDYNLDVGKTVPDGMKQGIQLLGKEMLNIATDNKPVNEIKDKFKEKTNKFDNLKIEGEWTFEMDRVVTSFLNTAGNKWFLKFEKDGSVLLDNKPRDRKWNYENDTLEFKNENFTLFNNNEKIKFIKYNGDYCYEVLYNDAKASMCKTKGERFKDRSKAVKIEIH